MAKTDTIAKEITVAADIEAVWAALTDPAEVASWFGDFAEIDLRPGGAATFGWSEHGARFAAVVEVVEPPARFAYRWAVDASSPVGDGPSTLVEFTLEEVAGGTRVRLVESGFAALPDKIYESTLAENTSGWRAELDDLAAHVGAASRA